MDGQTDGQTLFYRTLRADAGGPRITFATSLHVLIELQNSVLIYRPGKIVALNLRTGAKASYFGVMAPYSQMAKTLQKWRMN